MICRNSVIIYFIAVFSLLGCASTDPNEKAINDRCISMYGLRNPSIKSSFSEYNRCIDEATSQSKQKKYESNQNSNSSNLMLVEEIRRMQAQEQINATSRALLEAGRPTPLNQTIINPSPALKCNSRWNPISKSWQTSCD
jgi:hypothetical protein